MWWRLADFWGQHPASSSSPFQCLRKQVVIARDWLTLHWTYGRTLVWKRLHTGGVIKAGWGREFRRTSWAFRVGHERPAVNKSCLKHCLRKFYLCKYMTQRVALKHAETTGPCKASNIFKRLWSLREILADQRKIMLYLFIRKAKGR